MTDKQQDADVISLSGTILNAPEYKAPPAPSGEAPPAGGGGPDWGIPSDRLSVPPGCPITPLGIMGDVFHYLDASKQLRPLKAKDHSRLNLWALCGDRTDWLYNEFPRTNKTGALVGWHPEKAAELLMTACSHKGVWNALERVRGRGGWLGPDFELILHCGDVVMVDGKPEAPGEIGGYVYPAEPPLPKPSDQAAAPGDHGPAGQLLGLYRTWQWQRPETDAHLLLGWTVAAMAGGALDWRPLAWITGDRFTGKSTLHKVLAWIFDGGLVQAANATAAGIWQEVRTGSIPVALDEIEAGEDNRRVQAVVELARLAASGALVLRGGADHTGTKFIAQNCFLFSSINVLPMLAQDRSRMAVLELEKLQSTVPPVLEGRRLKEIGRGLRRRLVDHWPRMNELLEAWRRALTAAGHSGRGADVYGTLLACADLALNDHPPTADDFEIWGERLDAATLAERDDDVADHDRCINHLLTSSIDLYRHGMRRTVGSWILEAAGRGDPDGGSGDVAMAQKALAMHGMRVEARKDGARFLVVANVHEELSRIFRDTKWQGQSGAAGGWTQSLRRIEGAKPTEGLRFQGAYSRATRIPLVAVVGAEGEA